MTTAKKIAQPTSEQLRTAARVIRARLKAKGVASADREDVAQDALEAFCKFDAGKAKPETWASRCADNAVARYRRRAVAEAARDEMPIVAAATVALDLPLSELVRRACVEEFEATWGKPWTPHLERLAHPPATSKRERDARDLLEQLRTAIRAVQRFADGGPNAGEATALVCQVASEFWPNALRRGDLDRPGTADMWDWPPHGSGLAARRAWLASAWSRRPPMLQTGTSRSIGFVNGEIIRTERAVRRMTARQLAIVSLLAGNRPPGKHADVESVIKGEIRAMANALKRYGAPESQK